MRPYRPALRLSGSPRVGRKAGTVAPRTGKDGHQSDPDALSEERVYQKGMGPDHLRRVDASKGAQQEMGLVQMAYVLPALDHLRARGVPLDRHLRAVALSDFALDDAQAFVPAACVTALLERIAAKELSSDPIGDLETAYRLKHTHHFGEAVICPRSRSGTRQTDFGTALRTGQSLKTHGSLQRRQRSSDQVLR